MSSSVLKFHSHSHMSECRVEYSEQKRVMSVTSVVDLPAPVVYFPSLGPLFKGGKALM